MNLNNIGTQLLFTTVPIWVEKNAGSQVSGTGFIYTVPVPDKENVTVPFLITNLHVVRDAKRGLIEMVERKNQEPNRDKKVRAEIDGASLQKFMDAANDLAAIPIAPIINQFEASNHPVFFRTISPELIPDKEVVEKLGAIEEVTFIGYPSGIYDEHNAAPLIRRGITASPVWNDFQGKPMFIIDAGVFPGSSGSPVFIYNQGSFATDQGITVGTRILFIGIISETFLRKGTDDSNVFLGLGKVIKSQELKEFISGIIKTIDII